jgi:hypothetical protein
MVKVAIKVRPGRVDNIWNYNNEGGVIVIGSPNEESLKMRLKIMLRAPRASGRAGQKKLIRAIDILCRTERQGICRLADMFGESILSDNGFGFYWPAPLSVS